METKSQAGPVLMTIEDLAISYGTGGKRVQALRRAGFEICAGEVVGIVGESGSGKSTLVSALINLMPANARVEHGAIHYRGRSLLDLPASQARALRGSAIAMIFQDPMTAFNPVMTIGAQLCDFLSGQTGLNAADRKARVLAGLASVGIADPARVFAAWPHELSGGMRQRAAIAAALMMTPDILIADEPTTALDVTMEAQIIHLMRQLSADYQGGIVIVTHHLGVIAELCDVVHVMYAGEIVESGPVDDIFHAPAHPYTRALIACDPAIHDEGSGLLPVIGGQVPDLSDPPPGCAFAERCTLARDHCRAVAPERHDIGARHAAWCHEVKP